MSNLLLSLGHTLNTQTLMNNDEEIKGFKQIYNFVLGHIHSHPGLQAAHGPQVGQLCLEVSKCLKGDNSIFGTGMLIGSLDPLHAHPSS